LTLDDFNDFPQQISSGLPQKSPDNTEAITQLQGARILLVEDDEYNQELATELLTNNGIDTTAAWSGKEALELLQTKTFDGILMDVQMPVMDGYEVTRLIRKQAKYKDVPIIALTANAMVGDRAKAETAGMNDYICKPLNINQIFSTMAKWITPSKNLQETLVQTTDRQHSESAITELVGIDTKKGLATCGGHPIFYRQMLSKFREHHSSFAREFLNARQNGDSDAAVRLVHTIKAGLMLIGATSAQQAAHQLEILCRDGKNAKEIAQALEEVEIAVKRVINGLDHYFSNAGKK